MDDKNNQDNVKQFNFEINSSFGYFEPFRLSKNDQKMLKCIQHDGQQESRKIYALISGCVKRFDKCLYKGQKYYIQDLQLILDNFSSEAPALMKKFNIVLNKSQTKVNAQCHNCANFTQLWKFCPTCEDVHYCHEGCEMKIKFTHQRQQCRLRPFPKLYKPLLVQIHIGSDLGKNIHFCFQHQVSMSLLIRGQKLLDRLTSYLATAEGSAVLDDYHVKNQNRMIKFQKDILNPKVTENKESLPLKNLDDISKMYTQNKTLRGLEIFLIENGAILWKNIRQIHDNHFREVFIFNYP